MFSDVFLPDGLILSFPQFLFGSFSVSQQPNILRLKTNVFHWWPCTHLWYMFLGRDKRYRLDWSKWCVCVSGKEEHWEGNREVETVRVCVCSFALCRGISHWTWAFFLICGMAGLGEVFRSSIPPVLQKDSVWSGVGNIWLSLVCCANGITWLYLGMTH